MLYLLIPYIEKGKLLNMINKQELLKLTKKDNEYIKFLNNRISLNISPSIAKDMIKFTLSKEEHNKVFKTIKEEYLKDILLSKTPTIHLVISQSGGGKTNLTSFIKDKYNINLSIDSDKLKKYHPLNSIIIKYNYKLYNYLTALDAYLFRDELYNEALSLGLDFILGISPSMKDYYFNVDFNKLFSLGYKIEVHVISVCEINSVLSIYERYYEQLNNNAFILKIPEISRAIDSATSMDDVVIDLLKLDININIYKRGINKYDHPILITNSKKDIYKAYKDIKSLDEVETLKQINERINNILAKNEDFNELISYLKTKHLINNKI